MVVEFDIERLTCDFHLFPVGVGPVVCVGVGDEIDVVVVCILGLLVCGEWVVEMNFDDILLSVEDARDKLVNANDVLQMLIQLSDRINNGRAVVLSEICDGDILFQRAISEDVLLFILILEARGLDLGFHCFGFTDEGFDESGIIDEIHVVINRKIDQGWMIATA